MSHMKPAGISYPILTAQARNQPKLSDLAKCRITRIVRLLSR